jgi:hypothetical protein
MARAGAETGCATASPTRPARRSKPAASPDHRGRTGMAVAPRARHPERCSTDPPRRASGFMDTIRRKTRYELSIGWIGFRGVRRECHSNAGRCLGTCSRDRPRSRRRYRPTCHQGGEGPPYCRCYSTRNSFDSNTGAGSYWGPARADLRRRLRTQPGPGQSRTSFASLTV